MQDLGKMFSMGTQGPRPFLQTKPKISLGWSFLKILNKLTIIMQISVAAPLTVVDLSKIPPPPPPQKRVATEIITAHFINPAWDQFGKFHVNFTFFFPSGTHYRKNPSMCMLLYWIGLQRAPFNLVHPWQIRTQQLPCLVLTWNSRGNQFLGNLGLLSLSHPFTNCHASGPGYSVWRM